MQVKITIDPNCEEPYAIIHTNQLTPTLQTVISLLEKEQEEWILTGQFQNKTYVIDTDKIVVIRTEGREVVLYDIEKNKYLLQKPLYELEAQLGKDFVRISKSAIANVRKINHVQPSFNGTMEVVFCNGVEEVITRNYRKSFKERLGV